MKLRTSVFAMAAAAVIAWSPMVQAGGYEIYEHGARAMGMAGAFTAIAQGPTAVFYNPAGIVWNEGTELGFGATIIKPKSSYTTKSGIEIDQEDLTFFPPHIYMTRDIGEKMAIGVGVFAPFGLGTEWPANWVGKYRGVKADLKAIYINPNIAFELSPTVAIGGGVDVIKASVEFIRNIPTGTPLGDATLNLTGDGTAVSFNAGVLMKPNDTFSVGVSYRHSATVEFDGDAEFTAHQLIKPLFPNGGGTAEIFLPNILAAGVAIKPNETMTLAFDLNYYGWGGADSIKIKFDKPFGNPARPVSETELIQNYENSAVIRFGLEQKLGEAFVVRGGYIYDQSPVQDKYIEPTLPDAKRNDFTVGFGIDKENMDLDFAYMLVLFSERESTNPELIELKGGTYKTTAHLFGFSFAYRF